MNMSVQIPWRSMPPEMKRERVEAMTEEGLTGSQIAARINAGLPPEHHITRNCIIGYWHRNRITSKSPRSARGGFDNPATMEKIQAKHREKWERYRAERAERTPFWAAISATVSASVQTRLGTKTKNDLARAKAAAERAPQRTEKRLVPVPHADRIAGAAIAMMDIRAFECRAVVEGKDELGLAMMCGRPVHDVESAWCAEHARLYTRPLPPRQNVAPSRRFA